MLPQWVHQHQATVEEMMMMMMMGGRSQVWSSQ